MTNQKPLISVIMPCFNAERHLNQSIQSVFEQTYPNIELIVINDGSGDRSLSILQAIMDPRLTILDQINQGVCKARNRGIIAAKGELIAFLDADDTWHPECLNWLCQALINNPLAALAYCGWQNLGLKGVTGQPFVPPVYEKEKKLELLFRNCLWPIHACLTRKKYIVEAGLFYEGILTSEDFLLWLKIGSKHEVIRVPEVLAYYHFHDGDQATRNRGRAALNHWNAQQLYLQQSPDILSKLGRKRIKELMHGELMKRGFECYWKNDLVAARTLFKKVMMHGYGSIIDWKYMMPSILPIKIHQYLISLLSR